MKLSKLLPLMLTLIIFSSGCTIKSQKMKEAKIKRAKELNENRKDIEELESRSNAIFFEPEIDGGAGITSYELDHFLNTKPSQRFILQDPKIIEVYENGETYDAYLYLGPDVTPRLYSYIFKVETIRKDELDSLLQARNDEDSRVFLVLKKTKVVSVPASELEATRISKQVILAEFVSMAKVASVNLALIKSKNVKLTDDNSVKEE